MPYDAVLDYDGVLYRIEVKGSSNGKFNVTRGTRSGKQILKTKGNSRTRVLSRDDCDFVVGVDSNSGECYIIPEDVIEIINDQNLSTKTLNPFREKWKLIMFDDGSGNNNHLTKEQTRDGLRNENDRELDRLIHMLGITIPKTPHTITGTKQTIQDLKDLKVYLIWKELANKL